MFHLINTFAYKFSDFTTHYLRDLAALTPKDVSDFLLTLSTAIDAHVKIEVLIDKKTDVLTFLR